MALIGLWPSGPANAEDKSDPGAAAAKRAAKADAAREVRFLRAAKRIQHGVVRITWVNDKDDQDTRSRNAIVVSEAGHLLMAGPRPSPRGTLYARFANDDRVKASFVAWDPESALTLLHIRYRDLTPLKFRPGALAPKVPTPRAGSGGSNVGSAPAKPAKEHDTGSGAGAVAVRPLESLPLGMQVMLLTGDGAVARGAVRAQDRSMPIFNPLDGIPKTVTGLVEAGLAVVPADQGAPWIDENGMVVGLQLATGFAETLPEALDNAGASDLRPRITPSAARGIPVSVLRIVTPLLIRQRAVHRAGLGVTTRACDETKRTQLADTMGCHAIQKVEPKGPGAAAGLRAHDILVGIEGEAFRPLGRLGDALLPYRPGDTIRLDVLRKGVRITVEVKLGQRTTAPR